MSGKIIFIAALNAFIAVAAGAFAAHGLKHSLSETNLAVFHTAADYQMIHALALLFLGLYTRLDPQRWLKHCAGLMLAGIVLFSGSLYALALSDIRWLGMITPLGGLCFLAGWLYLGVMAWRRS